MSTYFAQPYNINANGFYFDDSESFTFQSENLTDKFGNHVEEFEIQYIDGDDSQLFFACGIGQGNLQVWFGEVEDLSGHEKASLFYLCNYVGVSLADALLKLEDVCLSESTLKDAAEELFDEIYLAGVPEAVRAYIDYEKFARDCELGGDMNEFEFNGTTWTCTNASGI